MQSEMQPFMTKTGLQFPGFPVEIIQAIRTSLVSEYGINELQISEAASYSMAMVIRYALGLSAEGSSIAAIVNNSLSGAVALATVRQLRNAGASCEVLFTEEVSSELVKHQAQPLIAANVLTSTLNKDITTEQFSQRLQGFHNVICGLYEANRSYEGIAKLVESLNETSTPIHCVDCPLGVDADTGTGKGALFASSTISLGAPGAGLAEGSDYTGRHYLCDISIPPELYQKHGFDLSPLFSEQPVLQILPWKEPEETPEETSGL